MNNNFKIKRIVRANLPETNSSSSHSVVICTDPKYLVKPGDSEFNLTLRDDGVLYIKNRGEDFGWEYERYNDPMEKLWYVCGILFGNYSNNHKLRKLFKEMLMSYTGATDVIFEWEENRKNHPEDYDSDDYYSSDAPCIDHNSSDIFDEIVESKETIKNFIFNNKSWLFLGNDNSDSPEDFYDVSDIISNGKNKEPDAIISFNFGGDIGKVDIEVSDFTSTNIYTNIYYDDAVSDIVYDTKIGNFRISDRNNYYNSKYSSDLENADTLYLTKDVIDLVNGGIYWLSIPLDRKLNETIREKKFSIPLDSNNEEISKILNSDEYKNHWKKVDIEILTNEFGKIC